MTKRLLPIDRGIPIPAASRGAGRPQGSRDRIPWKRFEAGDSVFVRVGKFHKARLQMQLATNARRTRDLLGFEFVTRQVEGGVRVWRVK